MLKSICLVLLIVQAQDTPVETPDTKAGRHLAAWLKALNSGDVKLMREFHVGAGAGDRADRKSQQDARFHGQTRGVDLRRIEQSSEDEITVFVQAKLTEAWYRVAIKNPPTGLQLSVRAATNPAPRKLDEAAMLKAIGAYVDKLVAADVFSGAVLVARDGNVIFTRAAGRANVGCGTPNRLATRFNLASMNKMFTSIAVCRLAGLEKLKFGDTVGKYLENYPNNSVAEKVTIGHLLTHTSGMGDFFTDRFWEASRDRFRRIKDYFPLFVDQPLEFDPGARFRYSNAGFMVLGAILEKVAGEDYFEHVREHVLKPSGMSSTDFFEADRDAPDVAIGYTSEGEPPGSKAPRRNNLFVQPIKGSPAGGAYSTVEDLLRFERALRQNRLLSADLTALATSGKVIGFGPDSKYAYGFVDEQVNGRRIVGHGGGFPGANSQLDMYWDSGYVAVVLANYDPPAAQLVAGRLREMITTFDLGKK